MSSSVLATATSHRELVENLVLRDVKSRYKQSLLGYAWAIANPMVLAITYWVVGGIFLQQKTGGLPWPIFAYFGLLYWNLFATGLLTATESLVSNLSLITKIYFPRETFPLAAVLSKTVDFGFGAVGIIPLLIFFRILPSPMALLNIPLLLLLLIFTTGLGMLTASANLFYRDVRYLVTMSLGIFVYLVPNIYPLSTVPEKFWPLYLINPVAVVIEASRRATFPQTGSLAPLLPYIGLATLTSLTLLMVGYIIFKRDEPRFAESI